MFKSNDFRSFLVILILLLIASSPKVFSQSDTHIVLKGIVRDSLSQETLPFATVYFKELKSGTVTNRDGEFEFTTERQRIVDRLFVEVSFLGYSSKSVLIDFESLELGSYYIDLVPAYRDLGTVVVKKKQKSLKALDIIKRMLQSFPETFNQEPYILNAYYRQSYKDLVRNEYDSYIEADVGIHYDGKMQLPQQQRVNQVRIQEDYSSDGMDSVQLLAISLNLQVAQGVKQGLKGNKLWKGVGSIESFEDDQKKSDSLLTEYLRQFHSLKAMLMECRIFNYSMSEELPDYKKWYVPSAHYAVNLHDDFSKRNKFMIDSLLYEKNDLVYKIKFLPRSKGAYSHLYSVRWSNFAPVGYIYVRDSDFSIVKFSMQFVAVSKEVRGSKWTYKVDIDFIKKDGFSYPFYVKIVKREPHSAAPINANSKNVTEKEFLVYQIITEKEKIQALDKNWARYADLYDPSYQYDSLFWLENRFIKETIAEQELREQLEQRIAGKSNQ